MSTDRGVDREYVVCIYINSGILFSHEKNEIMPFSVTWMDLESVILSEISQRRRNIVSHPLYMESKNK